MLLNISGVEQLSGRPTLVAGLMLIRVGHKVPTRRDKILRLCYEGDVLLFGLDMARKE